MNYLFENEMGPPKMAHPVYHLLQNWSDKQFRCEICMQRFGRKYDLKKHLNSIHARNIT